MACVVSGSYWESWDAAPTDSRATTASNQSILKEIGPGCSLEGLMLELKFQYFDHLMQRLNSLEKTNGKD